MKLIDSNQRLILSADEVCCLGQEKINNTDAFSLFSKGIKLDAELMLSPRWTGFQFDQTQKSIFDYIILELLPAFYDEQHLKNIGDVSFRINDIESYTMASINDRVVTMAGAPIDLFTHEPKIDFIIDADVFLSFCRGLVLEASEKILADDDEWEDREVSIAELERFGMPAGGSNSCAINLNIASCVSNLSTDSCGIKMPIFSCTSDASTDPCSLKLTTSPCISNTSTDSSCGAKSTVCVQNLGGGTGCIANSNVCVANLTGGTVCGTNVINCAANLVGGAACGVNIDLCTAKVGVGVGCAAKTGVCAANLSVGNGCGANAGACGANLKPGSVCGAKAGACGVDIVDICPVNAVVCGINFPGDIVGACIINIIPGLPSC